MSTITAVVKAGEDGMVHLPVPPGWRDQEINLTLELATPASDISKSGSRLAAAGLWKDHPREFWMAADFDAPLEDFREYME